MEARQNNIPNFQFVYPQSPSNLGGQSSPKDLNKLF